MTFEENPFRVLQVSIYDTKAAINERADELSFEDPDREEIFEQARTTLLNPKKRIAAEIRWFLDNSREEKYYSVEDKTSVLDIFFIDRKYSGLNAKEILNQINSARAVAKFPAVQDTAAIKSELKNIRYEIREKIQDCLKDVTRDGRIRFANDLADLLTNAWRKFLLFAAARGENSRGHKIFGRDKVASPDFKLSRCQSRVG